MDGQKGWRRCTVCQGLINVVAMNGTCVGLAMHQFLGSTEYVVAWGSVEAGAQPGWAACQKCAGLVYRAGGGVCHDGTPHEFAEYGPDYSVSTIHVRGRQPGWRWCRNCQRLWRAPTPAAGGGGSAAAPCFAGGVHVEEGSAAYTVTVSEAALQTFWARCPKCQALIRGAGQEGCVDGGIHEFTGVSYLVAYGAAASDHQAGWRYCDKCTALVLGAGACFRGGQHEYRDSLVYSIPVDIEPVDAQPDWRWCSRCQILSYSGFEAGPCPAGGTHDHGSSQRYSIYPHGLAVGQPGWRLCRKCRTMTLGTVSAGHCGDGGLHDLGGSLAYQIIEGGVPTGADGSWNWCHRCQALAHGGPSFGGICFDGAPHDFTQSAVYAVSLEPGPEGGQAGWHRCARCAQLALPAEDGSTGLCADGAAHDFTGSPVFTVAVTKPAAPLGDSFPTLVLTESETMVTVDGTGFAAGASVEVSFIGAGTAKRTVTADDAGAFHLEAQPVQAVPPEGGSVIARESAGTGASGRLRQFVPTPP